MLDVNRQTGGIPLGTSVKCPGAHLCCPIERGLIRGSALEEEPSRLEENCFPPHIRREQLIYSCLQASYPTPQTPMQFYNTSHLPSLKTQCQSSWS
jgi:hypothetical protein